MAIGLVQSFIVPSYLNLNLPAFHPPSSSSSTTFTSALSGCLMEILASRSNAEIKSIKAAYKQDTDRDLEEDLKSETYGHFKHLLVNLAKGARNESVKDDFETLYEKAKKDGEEER